MKLITNVLYNHKIKRVHLKHRRAHIDEYKKYDSIIEKFRSCGGLKHHFQAYKLYSLAHLLKQEKPGSILELGTGTSTSVFADYIRKEEKSHLVSVDENQKWLNNSRQLSRIDENDKRINLVYAPRSFNLKTEPKEFKYDYNFERAFDFVLIDGPSLRVGGNRYKDAVNTNIFDIVKTNFPDTIIVDIRKATVNEIVEKVGEYYNIYISDVITGTIRNNYRYFSIFKLK
jgi:hypothetical protein